LARQKSEENIEVKMGLKEAMEAIAAKTKDQLTCTDLSDPYIYYIRVDFDPAGINFCADEAEISQCKINAKAKAKLTYCQHLVKGGQPWPGLDVCKGCPRFPYESV
jgi:hypothetical protein